MLVVEIHFVFLRLDKQLTSAISAFKNSLKKPAWFDLFVQQKDCSLIPLELLDLILLPVELMKNPLARRVKKPRDVPGHSMSPEDGRYLECGRARDTMPSSFHNIAPCQVTAWGWRPYYIWYKTGSNCQIEGVGIFEEKIHKNITTRNYLSSFVVFFFFFGHHYNCSVKSTIKKLIIVVFVLQF